VFWRNPHPGIALGAVHRALDLARDVLLLEPLPEEADELVEPRAFHPHRVAPHRRSRQSRRAGAVLARPQHCITPLVRSAPCSHVLAGRH
jgi:hypothetical protein